MRGRRVGQKTVTMCGGLGKWHCMPDMQANHKQARQVGCVFAETGWQSDTRLASRILWEDD